MRAHTVLVKTDLSPCVHATCVHSHSLLLIGVFEFGTRGSEVQILSPRPIISRAYTASQPTKTEHLVLAQVLYVFSTHKHWPSLSNCGYSSIYKVICSKRNSPHLTYMRVTYVVAAYCPLHI